MLCQFLTLVELAERLRSKMTSAEAMKAYVSHVRCAAYLDLDLFQLTPLEANALDPQQKLVLEVGYGMLRRRGRDRAALGDSRTGVFLGMMNRDADEMLGPRGFDALSPFDLTGNGYSAAGARLSYVFAMRGPCQTVDTACSSTLVAAHAARGAVRGAEALEAVVLGPNLHLHCGVNLVGGAVAAMNSVTGRCHTLDARANGYLRAEGCGGVLIALEAEGVEAAGLVVRHNGRAAAPRTFASAALLRGRKNPGLAALGRGRRRRGHLGCRDTGRPLLWLGPRD